MRLRLPLLALLWILASCGASAASPRHCGPVDARTLASSEQARVYSWRGGVFGCSFTRGRSFRLGGAARSIREPLLAPVALTGSAAAYGLTSFGVDTGRTDVVVRRLTDGTQLASFPATRAGVVEGFQSIGSLAVKSDGAAGWIGIEHSIVGARQVIEVRAADASASPDRLLDSGAQVDPRSLRLHGSTLTWKHGAATRQATLR